MASLSLNVKCQIYLRDPVLLSQFNVLGWGEDWKRGRGVRESAIGLFPLFIVYTAPQHVVHFIG